MQLPAHIWGSSQLPAVIVSWSNVHETFDASTDVIRTEVWASVAGLLKQSGIVFASQQTANPIHISIEWNKLEWMVH